MRVLAAGQARWARERLGLTQSAVAAGAGINRPILSMFETGRTTPTDEWLTSLRGFYEDRGINFEEGPQPEAGGGGAGPAESLSARGGFVVPDDADVEEVGSHLSELRELEERIAELLSQPVEHENILGLSFPGDGPTERSHQSQAEIVMMMVRAYCLTRAIQGKPYVKACTATVGDFCEGGHTKNQEGWLSQLIGDWFGFVGDDDDPEAPTKRTDVNSFGVGRRRPRGGSPVRQSDQDSWSFF